MYRTAMILAMALSLGGCNTVYVYEPLVVTYQEPPIVFQNPPAIILDGQVQEFRVIQLLAW